MIQSGIYFHPKFFREIHGPMLMRDGRCEGIEGIVIADRPRAEDAGLAFGSGRYFYARIIIGQFDPVILFFLPSRIEGIFAKIDRCTRTYARTYVRRYGALFH